MQPLPDNEPTQRSAPAREIAIPLLLAISLTGLAYRQGILVSYDGYHFCEMAKQLSATWPDHYGDYWPFGWPLLGALIARTGLLGAYGALRLLSLGSLAALLVMTSRSLGPTRYRLLLLCALMSAPVIQVQIVDVLSDLPFTVWVLGFALAIADLHEVRAPFIAAGCCVVGFSIRYAGVFLPGLWLLWILFQWKSLRANRRLPHHLLSLAGTGAILALLIQTNLAHSGYTSGGDRGATGSLLDLPRQLALFGWSAPSALLGDGLRDAIGAETPLGLAIGAICFCSFAIFLGYCWRHPLSKYTRPLMITALGYGIAMACMRSIAYFDGVYNARTFLPALPPTLFLLAERLKARPRWSVGICVAVLGCGAIAAARGVSRQTGSDVRPAIAPLLARLERDSTIGINDNAFTVSAYVARPTQRVFVDRWDPAEVTSFLVIAGNPRQRTVIDQPLGPKWSPVVRQLVHDGGYAVVFESEGLVLLHHDSANSPAQPRSSEQPIVHP